MRVVAMGGAGAMGRAAAWELAGTDGVDLTIADADADGARELAARLPGSAETARIDVTDDNDLRAGLEDADVVANALPYAFNVAVMEAALESGVHYLDLGGLYHVTNEQLEFDDAFADAGLTAVLGMGASPGLTNVAAARGAQRLDRVREIHIRTGAAGGGQGFAYSAKTVLDELTMAPVIYEDGAYREVEPLSGRERYTLPDPVGTVEGFHSIHSELATMPDRFEGVEAVDFRVAFSSELVDTCATLIELGLTSEESVEFKGVTTTPREFIEFHLGRQPKADAAEEWKSFQVDIAGERGGEPAHYRYTTVVASQLERGLTATAVWTGVPMGLAAVAIGEGRALADGAHPPETAIDPEPFLDDLADRDIVIEERRVE